MSYHEQRSEWQGGYRDRLDDAVRGVIEANGRDRSRRGRDSHRRTRHDARTERRRRDYGSPKPRGHYDPRVALRPRREESDPRDTRASRMAMQATAMSESNKSQRPRTGGFTLDARLCELLRCVTPTPQTRQHRMQVLQDVQRALHGIGLTIALYGSMRTGLLIPSSDIDCVMLPIGDAEGLPALCPMRDDSSRRYNNNNNHGRNGSGRGGSSSSPPSPVMRAIEALRQDGELLTTRERKACFSGGVRAIANVMRASRQFRNVLTIAHARVPIVKCVHRALNVRVDLSFTRDGCATSTFLCNEMRRPGHELARALIVLVKLLLVHWGLDDPSVGGLGSFPVALMVLFYLQSDTVREYNTELRGSIGALLAGFLHYYGHTFDFVRRGIDYVKGHTFDKPPAPELFIVNPMKPGTNCAKAATLYASQVLPHFQQAARSLLELLEVSSGGGSHESGMESRLEAMFGKAVPWCHGWHQIRQAAEHYGHVPQHQWDLGTQLYIGGVMDL